MIAIPKTLSPFADQSYTIDKKQWSVPRIAELAKSLPVFDAQIKSLSLRYTFGEMEMREMISHVESVQNANLDYPIIISAEGVIFDGRHRLIKAILMGHETIKAVRFDEDPAPCKILD